VRLLLAVLILLLAAGPARAAGRVVSLNLCTDQMLVLLAPEQVAALSPLARDPALSFVASQAAALPRVRASAEAVLGLHPDLVLGARFGAQATLAVLEQEGVRVVRLDLPADFDGIRAWTRMIAALLGVPDRGEALIAGMDRTLAITHPAPSRDAIAVEPRGFTAGGDTILGAAMRTAGLLVEAGSGRTTLETLVRHPPGLLVVPDAPRFPSLATAMLDHPALRDIPKRAIPPNLTICPGPFSAQAVALLAS
jgi:iron complex transport system substrate-binding protein